MSSDRSVQVDARLLAAYLEGEVTGSERGAVEAALADSAPARRTLAQLSELKGSLSQARPDLEQIDLSARVFEALREPLPERARRGFWGLATLGAAAAALCVFGLSRSKLEDPSEFRARSGDPTAASSARWAGIQVYRVAEPSVPVRLGEHLAAGDGLLFSYTNLGARPFEYLMIFAVDASKNVRWFYPAYENAGTDPKAVRIEAGRAQVSLAELVHQDFQPGPLSIYALFAHQALAVSEVERWAARSQGELVSPFAETSLQLIQSQVLP
ncbi:MAG: hypothetical protein QM756_06745 [Polyangiaceae bacterium]